MAGVKKILLAQVAEFRAGFPGDFRKIIDDQADFRAAGDGQNRLGHAADFIRRRTFGAQLDQVRATVAKLLGKDLRRAAMEIGRVNERVKAAVRERFHGHNLTGNHTKHTKEFADAGIHPSGCCRCRFPLDPAKPACIVPANMAQNGSRQFLVLCLILQATILCAVAPAQVIPWQPFVIDHADRTNSAADVSFLLDAPAGRDGFIRVKDGHLVKPDGQRFRIWGVNLTGWSEGSTMLPPTNAASIWAAELARFGITCVRFHFLDRTTRERPQGLIDGNRNDSLKLDPARLDRLDFFIAELKKRGIYSDLNLNVGRDYKPGDGVPDYDLIGVAKGMTYFGDRLLELQRDYARQLLTHYNPYTRATYCNEPAVAIVEIANENSILEFWMRNWLRGELTTTNQLRYQLDLPPTYEKLLTARYNDWLVKTKTPEELSRLRAEAGVKGDALIPRLRREEFSEAPKERFYAEAAFYTDMETSYFHDMENYLKETLGVQSLVTGTADHTYWIPGLPLLWSTSQLDIVDAHVYWQHPAIYGARNTPMVNDPLHSAVVKLTRSAFADKPFTVSEVNEPNPNEYACEMIPLLAAYGAFQDWDGVFFYTFEPKISGWQDFVTDPFDITLDPVKMVQMEAGALEFLRPDVKPAVKAELRSYSWEQVNESMRLPESERPYFTPGFPLSLPLLHGSRVRCLDCEPTATFTAEETNRLVSDTGELVWQVSKEQGGLVTIDTERTQGLIGFVKANGRATSRLSA